tara:strand:- start:5012 stop:5146 length:135 start_codon:yes stop_codon:yes gene_type:complete
MAKTTIGSGDEPRHEAIITNMDIVSPIITGVNKKTLKIKLNDIK